MNDPKPFASLGPTLLARKGGARPAMRPQIGPLGAMTATARPLPEDALEDLGWNDMGEEASPPREAPVVPLTPAQAAPASREIPAEPEVRRQQRAIADTITADVPIEPAPKAAGRRAAFTLRLDPARHLKLRLACTVKGRSAQMLVTQALDKFLAEIPEIDALAAQLQRD